MKIVVTGGSGFIGTCLVDSLLNSGHDVSIFDIKPSAVFPHQCIVGDVRDIHSFGNALEGSELVYHLAAEHADDVRPVSLYYDVNVGGARNLVRIANQRNIKKIVFTSTVALYGLSAGIPDETFPVKPFNDYGKSKADAESVFMQWAKADRDNTLIILRPVVVFGENNRGNVYNLLKQIAAKHFLMIGTGTNKKSMAYVKNFVAFITDWLSLQGGIQIYNYADKPDLTTKEIVNVAMSHFGKTKHPPSIPFPIGLFAGYCLDLISWITGKQLPISSIRIRKFCAETQVAAQRLEKTSFTAPYALKEGLSRMLAHEFPLDGEKK